MHYPSPSGNGKDYEKARAVSYLAGWGHRENKSNAKDMVLPEAAKSQVDICEDEEEVMDF